MHKLLLAAAVAAALAACGQRVDTASSDAATTATPSVPPTASPAPAPDTTAAAPMPSEQAGSTMATAPATGTDPAAGSSTIAGSSDTTAGTSAMGATGSGQNVYNSSCAMCHAAGVSGAPKPGDKEDWKARIAQGKDTLYTHAIQGYQGQKGMMPPKGGNTAIPDADVKAAVDFMVERSM